MTTVEPAVSGGVILDLSSNVMQQYGRQIEAVVRESLADLGGAGLDYSPNLPFLCGRIFSPTGTAQYRRRGWRAHQISRLA